MTEQKIEPCEFVAGLCSHCGASERLGCEGWLAPDDRVQSLADQVEALTKERNALMAEVVYEKARKTIWQQQYDAAIEQRDAALEQNTVLDARCANLEAAAKLALDVCLDMRRHGDMRSVAVAIGAEAALRRAGVQ